LQLGVKIKAFEFGSFRQSDKLCRLENMIFSPICNFAFNSNLSFELKVFKMPRSWDAKHEKSAFVTYNMKVYF